jgi:hypothetical protein
LPQTCVLHPPFHLESSTLLQCLEHTLFDYKWCIPKYAYTWVPHSSAHSNSHPNFNTAFSRQSVQLAQELFLPNEDLFEQCIKLWYFPRILIRHPEVKKIVTSMLQWRHNKCAFI